VYDAEGCARALKADSAVGDLACSCSVLSVTVVVASSAGAAAAAAENTLPPLTHPHD
jgi:hypothetical protein